MTAQSVTVRVYGGVLFNAVPPLPRYRWWFRIARTVSR
jgi:hypothetical protein